MKRIPLGNTNNVRDLGGYPCPGGFTKHLTFLRSGMPRELTEKDIDFLLSNRITTVIDLRNIFECAHHEDPFSLQPAFDYHNCPMFADGVLPMSSEEIAWQLHFSSAAYFRRVFLKITGQTPGEYRTLKGI